MAASSYQGEVMVVQGSQNQQLLLQQLQQQQHQIKYPVVTTTSTAPQHPEMDADKTTALPFPVSMIQKAIHSEEYISPASTFGLTLAQIDALNNVHMPSFSAAQIQALNKAQLLCVSASLPRSSEDISFKLKPSEEIDSLEDKPRSPHTSGVLRYHSIQDVKPQLIRLSETSKSFSVASNSSNSVSPSGGRVTIQENQNTGLSNVSVKPFTQSVSLSQTIPTSLPTKIVQGPGRNEIQIQIKLSQNANDQSVGHIQTSSQGGTLQVPSITQKHTSDTPSIICSMLQAPRQPSHMIGQPGVQFPTRSKTDSPLQASRSFSGPTADSKVSMASLLQTGSLDSTADSKVSMASLLQTGSLDSTMQDTALTGKLKIGTSGSLHDLKKSMSRQGNVSSSLPQSKQPPFMSALQHRLSVPQSEPSLSMAWKREAMSVTDSDKLAILTTEHFKSQGMRDGLAEAAGAYIRTGSFTCEDCNESFKHETLRTQHRLQHCQKGKGLRRSLSATEVASGQGRESVDSIPSDHLQTTSGDLFILSNSDQLKKTNPALFKSLSTTDLQTGQHSVAKDLPKLREQLVLVSTSSPSMLVTASPTTAVQSYVHMTSSSSPPEIKPIKPQQNLIIENINPTQPRKKGRPKGSKNRPKDLNVVLAKARVVQIPPQAIVAGSRQGSIGSSAIEGSTLKDSLITSQAMSSQNQVVFMPGQYRKFLLPRSGTLTTQAASVVADASSTCALASSAPPTINQLLTTPATPINITMSSSNMIGQPMVPVISAGKIVRQLSSGLALGPSTKTNFVTATTKPGISPGVPLIDLSPAASLPGLTITGTNSMPLLSPGINCSTPGTAKPGGFMIGYPVCGITSSSPGTPVTSLTTINSLAGNAVKAQSLESGMLTPGQGLTLNITSAQSAGSAQFSQMSPRVIPFIPAVTFHNIDPSSKLGGSLAVASPLLDQKSFQQPQIRMSQITPFTLTSAGINTPGTPLTPATPDTPTDLSGTRRKLKDKLLMKQSLSVEKSQDKSQEKLLILDSPSIPQGGFFLKTNIRDMAPIPTSSSPVVLFQPGLKPNVISSNSALLASLTKPVVSSQKLGSLPNAVITSAVMGRSKEAEKNSSDLYTRSESETYINPDISKVHPPVLRAFSESAVAKKFKKSKHLKPSPLSVEAKNSQANSRLISRMLSTPKASQLTVPTGPEDLISKTSLSFQPKMENAADSFDSGLSLRSMSQENPFFFPKSASIASLDSNELLIDLSGDNFNNVTIPINYATPFVNVCRLQSGPLLSEWNHASRITGSQVNLSPLTLAGSKIQLPAVGGAAMMQREQKNWLLKRSLSLHRHFQILSRLWHSSSPVTLDSMTAMALAQGNPSPALLGRALLSYSSSTSSSASETLSTGTPGSADSSRMKIASMYHSSFDSIDLTKDEPSKAVQKQLSGEVTSGDQGSELKSSPQVHYDKGLYTNSTILQKEKAILNKSNSEVSSVTPSSNEEQQQQWHVIFTSSHALQLLTPIKSAPSFGVNITTPSLLSPSSVSSTAMSSFEQHISSVTPSGTLNTPMYGHSCPTLYTTTHVTFCCIQRPQPMYVAVKGSKKISMYSNWRLATHNPNPVGLTSRMLLALYKSRTVSNPVFAQCSMTPNNGGNQTHSSYWTYHRKKMAGVKKETIDVKNEDSKSNSSIKTEPGKDSKRHKLRLTKGGFKSNEKYEYIRGRGWGKYICEICGIRCKKPSMLKKHLRTHTDLRPYHCRHCRFSFKTKGNLTKHMKSKSHQKKCLELGIVPIPTAVDDSQIDPAALEEQCRISREARIHDSVDAQMASGEEDDDDDDMEGEDDDGDDDEEEEDDSMSREDTDDQSFDQERSGSSSSRVLKRQSSIDEPSPVFSFGQTQKSRPLLGQMGSKSSRNREFSESSNISYSSQSSMENRAFSPHNIDTEIARSLLDLSQPRRSESREIVDEDARRHALTHLQSLITQLMAQKKPLSGLNLEGDHTNSGTSLNSGKLMSLGPPGEEGIRRTLSLSSMPSLEVSASGSSQTEVQAGQMPFSAHGSVDRISQRGDSLTVDDINQAVSSESSSSANIGLGHMGMVTNLHGNALSNYSGKRMEELYVVTDDRHMRKGDVSRVWDASERKEYTLSPSSKETTVSTSSHPLPTRPTQLSLLKAPASPTKQQNSNLPSPSLFAFLPPYVSSRYAQRGRVTRMSDQGPIIGQFVRKDSQSMSTSNVAFTPNFVLANNSQPFQFNIPFHGRGISSDSTDADVVPTPSPVVAGSKGFIHTIPIVTITDTSLETASPTVDSPTSKFSDYDDGIHKPQLLTSDSTSSATTSLSSPSTSEPNKTTSTMPSSPGTTPQVNISSVKPSMRPTLESHGRSNSESATSIPKRRDSAIESLIRESAMPMFLLTGTEYSNTSTNLISMPSSTQISSPSPNSQSDSCIDSAVYPAGKRSRRLSSGKSRLRRQRSLADDTAFPSVKEDSVFEGTRCEGLEETYSLQQEKSTEVKEIAGKNSENVNINSFQDQSNSCIASNKVSAVNSVSVNSDVKMIELSSTKDYPTLIKEKVLTNVKPSSCAFCSESFHSVVAYTAHLQSRKHIGVLESLGMLPSGTYEKLQQSEQQENLRRKEEEKEKLEHEEATSNDMKPSTSYSISRSSKDNENQAIVPTSSSIKDEVKAMKMDIKTEQTIKTVANEGMIMKRSESFHEVTSSSTVTDLSSQAKMQRFSYKRKMSHQPVTETGTLLVTPHLKENLRQSLAKRARFGLTHSSTQSGESETDLDCPLVIDEPIQSPATTTSTLVSLLVSTKPSKGLITTTAAAKSLSDITVHSANTSSVLLSSPLSTVSSLTDSSSFISDKPGSFIKVSPASSGGQLFPDPASTETGMEIDEEKYQSVGSAVTKSASPMPGPSVSIAAVQPLSIKASVQTTASTTALSVPVSTAVSYSLNMSGGSQLQMPHITHAELRPYVCEFCDAGFTNDRSLRTHLLTHGQDRPYICGNCGDTFAQWQDREVHYSSHSSTSIRQHQNNQPEMRIQTTQSAPSTNLASHQSLARKEDNSTISHKALATFATNQSAGPTFSTSQNAGAMFSTNQNAGPTFSTSQNAGAMFSTNQNTGTVFSINQNKVSTFPTNLNTGTTLTTNQNTGPIFSTNLNTGDTQMSQNVTSLTNNSSLSPEQKLHLMMSTVTETKSAFSSSSTFSLNSKKLQAGNSENVSIGGYVHNLEKHQGQLYSLDMEAHSKNTDAIKSGVDSNANNHNLPVISSNVNSLNTPYHENTLLTYITHPGLSVRQDTQWNNVSNSKQDLWVEATRENCMENAESLNSDDNSRVLGEKVKEIEDVRHEQVGFVFTDKNYSEGSEQKVNIGSESMILRDDLNEQSTASRVGDGKIIVSAQHGQTMEADQQQQLKGDQVSQLGQGAYQFQLVQQEFSHHQQQQRHFSSPVYTELQVYKQGFPSSESMTPQNYQLSQEGRTTHYGNIRGFDNMALNSGQIVSLTMGTQIGQNPANWNQHSVRANPEMLQFNLGHENVEGSPSMCHTSIGHNVSSQDSMVQQRGQYSRSVTSTESNVSGTYKAGGYSEASSHEESMEYQSGYNGDNTHGFTPCQTEQDCEEQSSNPMLLPQTYYGLS